MPVSTEISDKGLTIFDFKQGNEIVPQSVTNMIENLKDSDALERRRALQNSAENDGDGGTAVEVYEKIIE